MFARSLEVIGAVWANAALGTGLIVAGAAAGWAFGQATALPPVRLIAWWLRRVLVPLLQCGSWRRCAATIFVNNLLILAALSAVGRWHVAALLGAAALGISMGISLRVFATEPDLFPERRSNSSRAARRCMMLGISLNLLEPPAIALAVGLSLGRTVVGLTAAQVWTTFLLWVVPATLLAAGGEALWLGSGLSTPNAGRPIPPQPSEPPLNS